MTTGKNSRKLSSISTESDQKGSKEIFTIDKALEQTCFGKFNYVIILYTGLISVNVVFESLGISYILPVLNCDLQLTHEEKGILGALNFIGIVISSPFWGFLADTNGRKQVMLPALFLNFCNSVCSSFSINFEMLAVLRFFGGICLSAGSATVYAYIGEFHSKENRNRAFLAAAIISAVSAIAFPFVVGLTINQYWQIPLPLFGIIYKPWRFCFVVCGLPGLLCGVILIFLPESPKYLLSSGRPEEALEVLHRIHKANTKNLHPAKEFKVKFLAPDSDTPIKVIHSRESKSIVKSILNLLWQQTAPLFKTPHLKNTLLASVIQFIIFYSAHGFYVWFPFILNYLMEYPDKSDKPARVCQIIDFMRDSKSPINNYITEEVAQCSETLEFGTFFHSVNLEIIYICILLLAGYATGKLDRRLVLFLSTLFCGLCGALSLMFEIQLVSIYLMIIMLCCGVGITIVNSIVVDIFPTNLRAMAVCISLMLGRTGSITGSYVIGLFIDHYCNATFSSFMITLILSGCLGFLLPKTNSMQSKNEVIEKL